MRRRWRAAALLATAIILPVAALAAEQDFPFEHELLLDTAPLPGSKRVPTLEVAPNGAAVIDLWCARVQGQLVLAGETVTVLIGPKTPQSCTPQQAEGDAALVAALEGATTWRAVPDGVELRGARTIRFLLSTH